MAVPPQALRTYTFLLAFCASCFVFSSRHRPLFLLSSALLLLGTCMLLNSHSSRAHNRRRASKLHRNSSSIDTQVATKVRTKPTTMETDAAQPNPKLRRSLSLIVVPSQKPLELDVLRRDYKEPRPLQQTPDNRTEGAAVSLMPASSDPNPGGAILGREPSLTAEEVKQLADAFIERFHEQMRLQRQDSYQASQENIRRQGHAGQIG